MLTNSVRKLILVSSHCQPVAAGLVLGFNHVQDTARGPGPARDPILSGPRDVPKV